MSNAILVLNAGSSSLKFTVYTTAADGSLQLSLRGNAEELGGDARFIARGSDGDVIVEHRWRAPPGHAAALDWLLDWLDDALSDARIVAIGHRVVHGGADFTKPARIDAATLEALEALTPLAPLHQPHNVLPIRALMDRRPDVLQVACFDTAFHCGAPAVAQAFALPAPITEKGVRRYGFHGLSYEYIASILPDLDPKAASGRTVVMHLGNGASMCALKGGVSIATTMGFTALDGLVMGTRCGALDAGVLLYMMQELGMDAAAIEDTLYRRSGLLGVSGISSDMRELLASEDPQARFALDVYVHCAVRALGALTAALEGLDAIVFTAGVGENAAEIRTMICDRLQWLGVKVDPAANAVNGPRISAPDSPISIWVAPTNEELMIARHALRLAH